AAEHALRVARRSDLPRAQRSKDAGAGGGARRRRLVASARNQSVRRTERRRKKGPPSRTLIRYRAAWILPIGAAPIRAGFVIVERGRIVSVSSHDGLPSASDQLPDIETVDLGAVAVLPGLVNAHTHLEL